MPGTGDFLHAVFKEKSSGDAVLARFDMVTHSWTVVGNLGPTGGSVIGAVYADPDFLYISDNTTGEIYRVDVVAATATFLAQGPVSSLNDGTRCSRAPVDADEGDVGDDGDEGSDGTGDGEGVDDGDAGGDGMDDGGDGSDGNADGAGDGNGMGDLIDGIDQVLDLCLTGL